MQNQTVAPLALLKTAFESEHMPALIAGSQTHEPALRYVAQLVRHTSNAAYIEAIIKAALPKDYAGNTLAELPAMIAGALEKGFDQAEIKRSRKAPVDQASDFYEQSGAELFHDLAGRPFIALPSKNGEGAINVCVESGRCRLFVQRLYYERLRKALPAKGLDQLIELLRARAIFDGPRYSVFTRIGRRLKRRLPRPRE